MRRIAIIALSFAAVTSLFAGPRQNPQRQNRQNLQPGAPPNAGARPNRPAARRTLMQEALFSFYVKQLQQDGEIPPEVFTNKIFPYLDEFLQARLDISERHNRALNQMRQAVMRNAPEEEFKRLVRELDAADADAQANLEKFLSNVDPLLNPRQQAKLRILQNTADTTVRQLLNAVQNANGQRGAAAPPASEK
jgi:hypothetical protein